MKVADVMSRQVEYVDVDMKMEDVCRLIFGRGINGVPVCKGKKLVGFITERDILAKFYPSMQEYVEDTVHTSDFEAMEEKASEILSLTAEKVMSRNPTTVTANTPLLRAQSLMFVHKVGRLPVVDGNGRLIGILSKGDIFRSVVGKRLSFEEEEGFYDWMAKYYDVFVNWKRRLAGELPALVRLFRAARAKKILDIASSTGEHSIALAKRGFNVVGVEASRLMHELAEQKREKLSQTAKNNVTFLLGSYDHVLSGLPNDFDAAIFLGNALPHVAFTDKHILRHVERVVRPKKSLLILQIANFEKALKLQRGFRDFERGTSGEGREQVFFSFYSRGKGRTINLMRAAFDLVQGKWFFGGSNSTSIIYVGQKEISATLRKLGFSDISLYGNQFYESLFAGPFKPQESDFLNIVAKR